MADNKETREVEILVNAQKANASLKEMAAGVALMTNQLAKMAADDPRREQLKQDFQDLKARVKETRDELNGYVKSEEQLRAENEALQASQAATIAQGQQVSASFREMKAAAGLLEQQLEGLSADDPGRAALIADYQTLRERMAAARTEFTDVARSEAELREEAEQLARANQELIATGQQAGASLNEMRSAASQLERQLHELSADDPGRAAMIRDFQVLQQRIGATRAELNTYVQTEEEVRLATARLNEENQRVLLNGQDLNASFNELRASGSLLEQQLYAMSANDPGRARLLADYHALQGRIAGVSQEMRHAVQESGFLKQAFAYALGGGIEQAAEKLVEVGQDIFQTTAKFETYGVVLDKALGNKSQAQKALADLQTMAAKTPFSVDELTGSFIKFVNRGLTPSMAEMTKLGDLASSQGKSFDQLTEAVLDAGTGEFERLKEFGIAASKNGNQVELSFKGVQKTVANTPQAIQGALLAFGEMKSVAGGMAAIADTLEGSLSNVGDTADQTAVAWGQSLRPAFELVLNTMGFLLGVLKALPEFVRENKVGFELLALSVLAFNAEQIKGQALALRKLALDKLVQLGLLTEVEGRYALVTAAEAQTVAQRGLNAALAANPIGIIIGLIALFAFGLKQLYDRSETFRAAVGSLWKMLEPFQAQLRGLVAQFAPLVRQLEAMFSSMGGGKFILELFGHLMAVSVVLPLKLAVTQIQVTVDALTGLWDVGKRVANFFGADFKVDPNGSFDALAKHLKGNAKSLAQTMVGTDVKEAATMQAKDITAIMNDALHEDSKRYLAAAKAKAAADAAARLEALQNQQADLKVRLANVTEGTKQEMQTKRALIKVEAAIELEDTKKTENERRIIRAEALGKIRDLEHDFAEKQQKEAEKLAKEKARRQAQADQARLTALKKWVKEEGDVLDGSSELERARDEAATTDRQKRREAERRKVLHDASAKYEELRALEGNHTVELQAILDERDLKLRELQAKWDEQDKQARDKKLQDQLDAAEAATQTAINEIEAPHELGLISEQEYQDQLYLLQKQGLEKRLALLEAAGRGETEEAVKLRTALGKVKTDHISLEKKRDQDKLNFEKDLAKQSSQLLYAGLDLLESTLDKKSEAYQAFKAIRKAAETAEIGINLAAEIQSIWKAASENPLNGPTGGAAGTAQGILQTALAVARAGTAVVKIAGFHEGGFTGGGMVMPRSLGAGVWDVLGQATGLGIGTGGKLLDAQGLEVAGLVHKNEYVIPEWMRADPQVLQVENWLEARRQRGFYEGGPTSTDRTYPAATTAPVSPASATDQQLVQVLASLDQRLQHVEQWPTQLEVVLDLLGLDRDLEKVKQLKSKGGIFG